MDGPQTWVEALKISPEKLSEWSSQAPSHTPLLVWCLQNSQIPVAEYLEWASANFGLPVLGSEFFQQAEVQDFVHKYHESEVWTSWCFPVGEWEDVTYVACVEPPPEEPEGKYVFCLSDPAAMLEAWSPTLGEPKPGDDAEAPPVVQDDGPAGINLTSAKAFVLNLDNISLNSGHAHEPAPAPAAVEDEVADEIDNASPSAPPAEDAPPMSKLGSTVDPHELEEPERTVVTLSVINDPRKEAPPPVPAARATPASRAAAAAATAAATAAAKPAPAAPAPVKAKAAVRAAKASENEDTEVRGAFDRLKQNYQHCLLMRCVEGIVKPYKWDEELKVNTAGAEVNLGFPSFLRIVAKTLQPYHGYVIDSPAHRDFFSHLEFSEPPACVTALPLKADNKLWGILVAFGGEGAQSTESLDHAQLVAENLNKALEPNWSKAAA